MGVLCNFISCTLAREIDVLIPLLYVVMIPVDDFCPKPISKDKKHRKPVRNYFSKSVDQIEKCSWFPRRLFKRLVREMR